MNVSSLVIVAFLIVVLGLTPALLSLLMLRQANARAQARLQLAMNAVANRQLALIRLPTEHQYVEGVGYMIGDLTCEFNARSSYIRCAVNPSGPCEGCRHYQAR